MFGLHYFPTLMPRLSKHRKANTWSSSGVCGLINAEFQANFIYVMYFYEHQHAETCCKQIIIRSQSLNHSLCSNTYSYSFCILSMFCSTPLFLIQNSFSLKAMHSCRHLAMLVKGLGFVQNLDISFYIFLLTNKHITSIAKVKQIHIQWQPMTTQLIICQSKSEF